MGQLKSIIYAFDARAKKDGEESVAFSLSIGKPEYDKDRGYFCRVSCPVLREAPFLIFGVDETQAKELSISFIRQTVSNAGFRLIDQSGSEVAIPDIDLDKSVD